MKRHWCKKFCLLHSNNQQYSTYFLTRWDRLVLLCDVSAADWLLDDSDSDRAGHWSVFLVASTLALRLVVRRPCCCMDCCVAAIAWEAAALIAALLWVPICPETKYTDTFRLTYFVSQQNSMAIKLVSETNSYRVDVLFKIKDEELALFIHILFNMIRSQISQGPQPSKREC